MTHMEGVQGHGLPPAVGVKSEWRAGVTHGSEHPAVGAEWVDGVADTNKWTRQLGARVLTSHAPRQGDQHRYEVRQRPRSEKHETRIFQELGRGPGRYCIAGLRSPTAVYPPEPGRVQEPEQTGHLEFFPSRQLETLSWHI